MTTIKTTEPRKFEEERFEFLLHVNNHIICQRFFSINNFNEDSINSYELKELIDNICGTSLGDFGHLGIIPNYLKEKSVDNLWNNYNPHIEQTADSYRAPQKKNEVFLFEIKVDKRVVAAAEFYNDYFALSAKMVVDIREIIPLIKSEIRYYLSQKNYVDMMS